jgi:hypothetical protein
MAVKRLALGRYANFPHGAGLVQYDGFYVLKESIIMSRNQLNAIAKLTPIQKQFIGTLVDTEVAVGYFHKLKHARRIWIAYAAVKMKYRGDLAYLAELVSHGPPSRSLNANGITHSLDLRWSVMVQGVVAYKLLKEVGHIFTTRNQSSRQIAFFLTDQSFPWTLLTHSLNAARHHYAEGYGFGLK